VTRRTPAGWRCCSPSTTSCCTQRATRLSCWLRGPPAASADAPGGSQRARQGAPCCTFAFLLHSAILCKASAQASASPQCVMLMQHSLRRCARCQATSEPTPRLRGALRPSRNPASVLAIVQRCNQAHALCAAQSERNAELHWRGMEAPAQLEHRSGST
jgi:hypothetical protein